MWFDARSSLLITRGDKYYGFFRDFTMLLQRFDSLVLQSKHNIIFIVLQAE